MKTISCETCKCLIRKEDAHKVVYESYFFSYNKDDLYYCQTCKPPYEEKRCDARSTQYFRKVEVNEKGKPLN